ncbi:MAG: sugar ABC transporter substrate-binding protein [Lachnospiraceae bacterium]|jgi:ribose transport system substrate-binding protein|nr:sugar ABC transporter substrate-binding protein [Lachnospiraceae bacterium]
MRNKRFVAMVVALATLAVMSLGGCSAKEAKPEGEVNTEAPEETDVPEEPSEAEAKEGNSDKPLEGMKIGFAHLTLMDEWCVSVSDAVETIGKELGAAEVNVQVAEFDLETQTKHIENFVNQDYDIIFLLTSFTDAILPAVQQAADKGIPVVAMDGTLEGEPLVSHIVWDQAGTGTMLGENVAKYVKENLDGKVRLVCLDSKTLEYMAVRQQAFLEELKKELGEENVTIVNDSDCQDREDAANVIDSIVEPYDLIYAASDSNAHGAIAGLERKGLSVPVFACGGYGQELYDAISDPNSSFTGTINIPGESIVTSAYDQLLKYLDGDTDIPERVNCEVFYVGKDSPQELIDGLKPAQ